MPLGPFGLLAATAPVGPGVDEGEHTARTLDRVVRAWADAPAGYAVDPLGAWPPGSPPRSILGSW